MNERFYVGEKYIRASKILVEGMLKDSNLNFSDKELSEEEWDEKSKSCAFNVILPSLFCLYQGIELILKGFVYLKNTKKHGHDLILLFEDFAEHYSEQKELIKLFNKLITNPIEIVNDYIKENKLFNISEFYNSLRYPDNKNIPYDYTLLLHAEIINDNFSEQINTLKEDVDNLLRLSGKLYRKLEKQ